MPPRNLFTVLNETALKHGSSPALYQPSGSKGPDKYRTWTWAEYRDSVREIACGLRSLGIGKGHIVALHSETRAEFYLADIGIMTNGSIAAALYTSLPARDHVKVVALAAPKAMFVEDAAGRKALEKASVGVPGMRWIVMTGDADGDSISIEDLRQMGREAMQADLGLFDRIRDEVQPSDPGILYMTSGATGEPKTVLTTHSALIANAEMGPKVLPLGPDDRTLAFLPSAHIAQRIVLEFVPITLAMPVYFSEGLAKMPDELRSVKPTFFLAPPRVWERVYSSISTEVKKRPPFAQKLFHGALGLGLRAARLRRDGKPVPSWMQASLKFANAIIFNKVRERLGGKLRVAASGAAPLGLDLTFFYEAIGMPLVEAYGITEGGVATMNPVGNTRAGSIGKALPGVELRLTPDGELLIRSPCLFTGYYQDPESTHAVLKDGWLYTGDIAEIDKDGYVFITGRRKELIVSSNGKKIYPSKIESLFKVEPLVNQVLLIGDRQPYVTALLTVNAAALDPKGSEKSVTEQVGQAVKRVNKQLAGFEQIRRFRILESDFSIERGELTPTMKIRRTQVLENYKSVVNELYLGKEELV